MVVGHLGLMIGDLWMLAFIDNPIQIAVIMILILVVFGPEKLKSIIRTLRD